MMAVSFVSAGTFAGSTIGITVTLPPSITDDDFLLLLIETACDNVSTPSGWTLVPGAPVTTSGSSGSTSGTRLHLFYRFYVGGDGNVTIPDTGNHQLGVILAFRGVDLSTPFDPANGVGSVDDTGVGTFSVSGITTSAVNRYIVVCGANPLDGTGVVSLSVSSSIGVVKLFGDNSSSGNGGAIGVWGKLWSSSGSTGTFSFTWDEDGGSLTEKQVGFVFGLVATGEGGGGGGGGGGANGSFLTFFN